MALNRSFLPLATMGLALSCLLVPAAVAQQANPPQGGPPMQQPPAAAVSDQEIETFVAAATEVRNLNKQWTPKVQEAAKQGPQAEQQTRAQALREMALAVEKKGMSVDRYQQIFEVARNDREMQRKIVEKMPKDE
ncbi:DUF4168 domain-containing protein [Vineibacter terrae]|nr:DUF4168 domain-containing protein [Vineibacter terrae]